MAARQVEVALDVVDALWSQRCLPQHHFLTDARFLLHGSPVDRTTFETLAIGRLTTALPDASVRVRRLLHQGDTVAMRATCSGTHTAELFGVPATGRTVSFHAAAWFVFFGSLLSALHFHWNGFAQIQPLRAAYEQLMHATTRGSQGANPVDEAHDALPAAHRAVVETYFGALLRPDARAPRHAMPCPCAVP